MKNNYKSEALLSKSSISMYEKAWEDVLVRNAGQENVKLLLNENYNVLRTYQWDIWKTRDMMVKEADENIQFNRENLENVFLEPLYPENVLKYIMGKNGWTMKEVIREHNKDIHTQFLRIAGLPKEGYLKNRECA